MTNYKDTIILPNTDFSAKRKAVVDGRIFAHWDSIGLNWMQSISASEIKDAPKFRLHDGPPYANGDLHLGHFLNKTIKDAIVRSHYMLGCVTQFNLGWDCHGLPIENAIIKDLEKKDIDASEVSRKDFNDLCNTYANGWVKEQRNQFDQMGINFDYIGTYKSNSREAAAAIVEESLKFVKNGTLYHGNRPVLWSPEEQTSLANADVEQINCRYDGIYVKYPVKGADYNIIIYTTTPWTIPMSKAICCSTTHAHNINEYKNQDGEKFKCLVMGIAAERFAKDCNLTFVSKVGVPLYKVDIEKLVCTHPLSEFHEFWNYDVPIHASNHVKDTMGSGFVHIAPDHGPEDFEVAAKHNIDLTNMVTKDGKYTDDVPVFKGLDVLKWETNNSVIRALSQLGMLLHHVEGLHNYPHSARSKKPLLYMITPQWFIDLKKKVFDDSNLSGKTIQERCLKLIDRSIDFKPEVSKSRFEALIKDRSDWMISRQRTWGIPLCVFYKTDENGKVTILRSREVQKRIVGAIRCDGTDAWFAPDATERFLGDLGLEGWTQCTDVLDVWFESGCSHVYGMNDVYSNHDDSNVVVEGTDQLRGWFTSSLIISAANRSKSPFGTMITHGFVVDSDGKKLSKSGNIKDDHNPIGMIEKYGVDIMRLWALSSDYTNDVRLSEDSMKTAVSKYNKIRNIMKFMIGITRDEQISSVKVTDKHEDLEKYIITKMMRVAHEVEKNYFNHDFNSAIDNIYDFMTNDLSKFYLHARKDALYCSRKVNVVRKRVIDMISTIMFHVTKLLCPITPVMCEEIRMFVDELEWKDGYYVEKVSTPNSKQEADSKSIHIKQFDHTFDNDIKFMNRMMRVRKMIESANFHIEKLREKKLINSSEDVEVTIYTKDQKMLDAIKQTEDLALMFNVRKVWYIEQDHDPKLEGDVLTIKNATVVAKVSELDQCDRCKREAEQGKNLCLRCKYMV